MIDYIKLDVTHVGRERLEQGGFVFSTPGRLNNDTGEFIKDKTIRAKHLSNYKNLTCEIFEGGKISLSGSLHRYWNDGKHNYNNFNFVASQEVIQDLAQRFGIDPIRASIHHVEIGINLYDLPFAASQIVQNLMIHSGKGNPPEHFKYPGQKTPSEYKHITRDWYTLKCYDKGKHYQRDEEIYRIECKAIKMHRLKEMGISTLAELTRPETMAKLLDMLLSLWSRVLINDWTIREDELNTSLKYQLKDWRNPTFWTNLNRKCKQSYRNKYNNELRKYLKIVQEHSDNVHKIIADSLTRNWCKNTTVDNPATFPEIVQEHPLIMDDLAPFPKRVCRITKIDISNQKEGSYYLRESTIEKIYIEAKEKYQFLKDEFGPKKKHIESLKDEFEAIAKNIRNRDSNPRKRERDIFEKFKNSLFPYEPRIPLYAKV